MVAVYVVGGWAAFTLVIAWLAKTGRLEWLGERSKINTGGWLLVLFFTAAIAYTAGQTGVDSERAFAKGFKRAQAQCVEAPGLCATLAP